MRLTKPMLYKVFNALGNLADKAGGIKMSVEAGSTEGIDRNWLRNAVREPLEELDIEDLDISES